MTGGAVGRSLEVAVTVNAIAHLQGAHLLDLCHAAHVAVARRANRGRNYAILLCEEPYVGLVDEANVVRHSVNPHPVDRFARVKCRTELLDFRKAIAHSHVARHA